MSRSPWLYSAVLCALASIPAAYTHAPSTASGTRIAFATNRDGNWEIYLADGDSTQQRRLTHRDDQDRFPLWSPDGSKIAFGTQAGGTSWQLWVMDSDGANPRALASKISAKGQREWSPDGTHIALSAEVDGDLEVMSVGLDGRPPVNLTKSAGIDRDPSWSRDGRQVVFSSTRSGKSAIYLMRADGSDVRRLTPDSLTAECPMFAPDGSAITFRSERDSVGDLWIMRPDGSQLRRLTIGARVTRDAVRWSPDATRIAYQAAHADNYDIDIVNPIDGKRTPFAATPVYDGMASWSPDSKHIVFVSARGGPGGDAAYIADADGKNVRRITASNTLNPAFAP